MRIVILDSDILGSKSQMDIFRPLGELSIFDSIPRADLYAAVKDAEVVVANRAGFNADLLSRLTKLRAICITATGTNIVDLKAAQKQQIAVYNVAGYSTESVAQHTFAMLLYLLEQLPHYDRFVKQGHYIGRRDAEYSFWEIHGKQWGIIGLGTIGRRVASIASSFGAKLQYASTSGIERKEAYPRVALEELLATSDIISIHAPLSPQTRELISAQELAAMKPSAIIINVGRGGIVDETALAHALDSGKPAAAGLDVLEREPMKENNPLLRLKHPERLLITPHIAWGSSEARRRLLEETAKNIERFLNGSEENRVI